MGFKVFRGDAQGRSQVDFATPSNVEVGDKFKLTINRKDIEVTAQEATVAHVVSLFVNAIGQYNNAIPEWAEISASTGFAADGVTVTHLILTGPTDGKPFTVTASTTDAGEGEVTVTVLIQGVAPLNEIQRVRLGGTPTGGTFTLTFAGQTTGNIAYNANAAAVVAALEALSNIGVGDVAVVESATSDWLVTFQGAYAETDVPILTGSGALLTGGGGVSVTTTQAGGGINEVQTLTAPTSAGGVSLYFVFNGGASTSFLSIAQWGSLTAAQVQGCLETCPTIGVGNVSVSKSTSGSDTVFTVTFVGSLAGINQPLISGESPIGTPWAFLIEAEVTAGATQNEKQTVVLTGGPTGGTFTLTFQGQTTAGIAFDATAATVDAALEALSNIGAGDVTCTGGPLPATPVVVEFTTLLANKDVQQMTGSGASLTGGSVNVSVTQEAVVGVNEKQQIAIDTSSTGGTFTLTYDGQTTAAIAYDATAATVDAALEALSNIGAGDVAVTGGPGPGTAWVVEFTGTLAETNVVTITGDGGALNTAGSQDLVISSSVTPTGPNWFDDPENWDTGVAPAAGDTLVFDDPNAGDVLYGIENISTALFAKIIVRASFENKRIGLLDHNGLYWEYRPLELKVQCTEWEIGLGAGSGHTLLRANCQAIQTTVQQFNSGTGPDAKSMATQIRGTHASNAAEILGGEFGSAADPEQVSTWATVKIGGGADSGTPPDVFLGACTLTNIDMEAGTLEANSAIAGTLRQEGGESTINGTGAIAQINLLGAAVCHLNTTGAIGGATIVADTATLDLGQDMSPKTFTNPIEIHGSEAKVNDPFKVINVGGSRVLDFNQSEVIINGMNLGRNVRVTLGTPA